MKFLVVNDFGQNELDMHEFDKFVAYVTKVSLLELLRN